METGATNSSTESCKTPVAPCSDVVITMEDDEDDDEVKSPLLISENECSSAEVIYVRKESTTEATADTDETSGTQLNYDDEGKFHVTLYLNHHFYRVYFLYCIARSFRMLKIGNL